MTRVESQNHPAAPAVAPPGARVHIERLVLHQVPAGEHAEVVSAFRAELGRLLTRSPDALAGRTSAYLSLSTPLPSAAYPSGLAYGIALAESVFRGLRK